MSISSPASISCCQYGVSTPVMYGCTALSKPFTLIVVTSMSFGVQRVWLTVGMSSAFTTDMSIDTPGLAASNSALKFSMNATPGGSDG